MSFFQLIMNYSYSILVHVVQAKRKIHQHILYLIRNLHSLGAIYQPFIRDVDTVPRSIKTASFTVRKRTVNAVKNGSFTAVFSVYTVHFQSV